jgi:hypothetical protein
VNTKRPTGLDFALFVPAGSVQLGQVTHFGIEPEIANHKEGVDIVRLRFTEVKQVKSPELQKFLANQFAKATVR